MLEKVKHEFEKNGYFKISDEKLKEDVKSLKNKIWSICNAIGKNEGFEFLDEENFSKFFNHDVNFRKNLYESLQKLKENYHISQNQIVENILCKLGLKAPTLRNVSLRIDLPNEKKYLQPMHQDVNLMESENCLNFWVPLQSVNKHVGTMVLFEGSHKLGHISYGKKVRGYPVIDSQKLKNLKKVFIKADLGNLVVFHPCLVHGSSSITKQIRFTSIFRYDDLSQITWLKKKYNPLKKYHEDIIDI